ncbi:hypothetical protein [Paenibacillus graminis]|uniref:hypothetical protein n=1 Tax=Paenibacillus graminis TaxID=189425 RepID=UPI002DBF08B2|nr:hypothetical protein [Paenibacillus graminis]MEC0167886.1 hypothetical protein [Paenibacillus graminis]
MTKIIDGRKAEITNSLQVYTNWVTLATEHGYPKAAYVYGSDPRVHLNDGDTVTMLTSTFVHDGAMIWVVQARNGEQFLYSEKGLRILPNEAPAPITVLPDESLGGTLREYREVKRKAAVGELVKVFGHGRSDGNGVFRVDSIIDEDDGCGETIRYVSGGRTLGTPYYNGGAYVVLEPTEILVIDGERLREVDRKAAVGERVIVTKPESDAEDYGDYGVGDAYTVTAFGTDYYGVFVAAKAADGKRAYLYATEYAVLEPVETATPTPEPAPLLSAQPAESQAAANVAVLTLKVTELEAQVKALTDWHRRAAAELRVAREDIVLIEEGVSDDIKALEKRISALEPFERKVASGPVDNTPPSFAKSTQQIRDEIVERAKADVSDLRKFSGKKIPNDSVSFWPKTELPHAYIAMHTVEFVVNSAKRTVVAIIRCTQDGLTTRGIAKCAPGETFNAHIGRAIALHRALGLTVPAEYLNAPGPTEVRVGDVVQTYLYGGTALTPFTVAGIRGHKLYDTASAYDRDGCYTPFEPEKTGDHITDDSRENGGFPAAPSALKGAA